MRWYIPIGILQGMPQDFLTCFERKAVDQVHGIHGGCQTPGGSTDGSTNQWIRSGETICMCYNLIVFLEGLWRLLEKTCQTEKEHSKGPRGQFESYSYRFFFECICYILYMYDWSSSKSGSQRPLFRPGDNINGVGWVCPPFTVWPTLLASHSSKSHQQIQTKKCLAVLRANGDVYSHRFQNAYRRVPGLTKHGISALKAVKGVLCHVVSEPLSK